MSSNSLIVKALPEDVWAVLADGWLYPSWVVGASRMREVDQEWPAVGSRIHHSVGVWPALIDDHTRVIGCVPGSLLKLQARAWPSGEADVELRINAVGVDTEVVIIEDVSSGPGRLVPSPFRSLALGWRNMETLRRLAYLAEGGASQPGHVEG